MNFLKRTLSAFCILLFLAMAIGSSGVKHMSFTKNAGQIPPHFGENKDTLLVLKTSMFGDYNSHLKKGFKKLYAGNYKIISGKELENYPAEKYRYIFEFGDVPSSILEYNSTTGMSKPGPGTIECVVTDRETRKQYRSGNTAFYGKLLKAYIPALSNELKH